MKLEGGFSKLDKRIFNFGLDQSSLYILCAINKCQKKNRAFPSYNKITKLTGLSRSTAISKVKVLQAQWLIAKETCHSVVVDRFINNAYTLISMELRVFLFALILKLNRIAKRIKESLTSHKTHLKTHH